MLKQSKTIQRFIRSSSELHKLPLQDETNPLCNVCGRGSNLTEPDTEGFVASTLLVLQDEEDCVKYSNRFDRKGPGGNQAEGGLAGYVKLVIPV
jgi:hypothetical protein